MRIICLLILILLTAPPMALGQTVNPTSGDDPTAWINRYPDDTVLSVPGVLAIPSVKQKLDGLLSKADLTLIRSVYTEEIPVAEVDGYIIVSHCMPHDCGSEGDTIVLNPKTNAIAVGFIVNDGGAAGDQMSERIYSTDDYTQLPGDVFKLLFVVFGTGQ